MSALDNLSSFIRSRVLDQPSENGKPLKQFTVQDHDVWEMLVLLTQATQRECELFDALSACSMGYSGHQGIAAMDKARMLVSAPDGAPAELTTREHQLADALRACAEGDAGRKGVQAIDRARELLDEIGRSV